MLTHYSPTQYFSECGYSCCTLYFSEGGFGAYTVHERPAWAPDDADVMNADIPRCIGRSGHTLGCVDLKKWSVHVEGNKDKGMCCIGIQSVLCRYCIGNLSIFYRYWCHFVSVCIWLVFDRYLIGVVSVCYGYYVDRRILWRVFIGIWSVSDRYLIVILLVLYRYGCFLCVSWACHWYFIGILSVLTMLGFPVVHVKVDRPWICRQGRPLFSLSEEGLVCALSLPSVLLEIQHDRYLIGVVSVCYGY
jgi:hypothetical protein